MKAILLLAAIHILIFHQLQKKKVLPNNEESVARVQIKKVENLPIPAVNSPEIIQPLNTSNNLIAGFYFKSAK